MKRRRQKIGTVAIAFLLFLSLGFGAVSAQESAEAEAAFDLAAVNDAMMIAIDLTITDITDPGTLWIDDAGLHIRGLNGIDAVSGDITGTATTLTNIDWAAPCNAETLVCLGAQTSFTQLTITDETGSWTGNLQLVIDPANATNTVGAALIGQGGNAGQALYLNAVSGRTDVSLSLTGYRIAGMKPVGGINLANNACIVDDTTASGGFIARYAIEDGGALQMSLVSGTDTALGMTIDATFVGAHGSLMGVDGEYAGYLGFGRTGTQVVESSLCSSGYEVHSFWIGEIYISG